MQPRFALRFENGERRGETVPITGSGVTVGRKPGNSIQILDASVSGRHAEFVLEETGVLLRDSGSTNGTRVGGERVSERRLAHGDLVVLGNVRLLFLDSNLPEPEPPVPDAGRMEPAAALDATIAGDSVHTISAEKVRKTGKRSIVGAVGLVVALGGAGGAWWYLQGSGGGASGAQIRPVEPVDGNLLRTGFSFEGDGAAWANDESAPAAFDLDAAARRSGANGLAARPEANGWALARSEAVKLGSQRGVRAVGHVRADDAATARLGLEFGSSTGGAATTVVWSLPVDVGAGFVETSVESAIPGCFDSVRVVVLARASGSGAVDVDDVALVPAAEARKPEMIDEFALFAQGEPVNAATLFKIDRSLLSDLFVRSAGGAIGERAVLAASKSDRGFELQLGSGDGRELSMRVDEALLRGGLATTGTGGYRTHATEFTREQCTSVIAGTGKDQIRMLFEAPITLRGRPEGVGMRLEAALGANSSARIQTDFRAERDEAMNLARDARESEKASKLGEAAARWSRLRDEYPFQAELLAEAESARARIAESGLAEVRRLRAEVERARFFRLVELYRKCKREAEAVAVRHAASEVEPDARALVTEIEREVAALEVDLQRAERERLDSIARTLDAALSPQLAAHVRNYVARRFVAVPEPAGTR